MAARSLAQAENVDVRAKFERSDAERLLFADESFDAVICECAFCTFPDKAAAAKEFFRVLRRGGRVGISDLTRETTLPEELNGLLAWIACIDDAQTIEGYTTFLQDAGFSVDSVNMRNQALEEMVNQVRLKLLGAEIMTGMKKAEAAQWRPGSGKAYGKQRAGSSQEGATWLCTHLRHQARLSRNLASASFTESIRFSTWNQPSRGPDIQL